jgi:hypothetical protein
MRSRRTRARARIAENRAATGAIFEAREILTCFIREQAESGWQGRELLGARGWI